MKPERNSARPLLGAFVALAASLVVAVGPAAAQEIDECDIAPGTCPSASIVPSATAPEGAAAEFGVTLSEPSLGPVTVNYATANGTAQSGSDYTGETGGAVVIPAGETTGAISIPTTQDGVDEANENFTVTLTGGAGTRPDGTQTGVATIQDDDPEPTLSISGPTEPHPEGDSATTNADFAVTLTGATEKVVTVNYSTGAANPDYTATSGTLTFNPGGAATQTVSVPVQGDTIDEPDQTLTVTLSGESNATVTTASANATIGDDDPEPSLSISGPTEPHPEGDSGTTNADFAVTLAGATEKVVTVAYTTGGGDATAGTDYTATSGTLTFNPGGAATQTISVPVQGDATDEADETFGVTLSAQTNASLTTASANATIADDDAAPSVAVADTALDEGDSGASSAEFAVTLSAVSAKTVTVGYTTADGSATSGSDYEARSGTLSFAPGEVSKTVAVPVSGDGGFEPDEDFYLDLSPADAVTGDLRARALVRNDDAAPKVEPPAEQPSADEPVVVPLLDKIAPGVSKLTLTNTRFRVGSAPTVVAARAKVGTAFRYVLTEPATMSIIIDSAKRGQTVRGKCVAPKRKRRARRCTRHSFVGAITRRSAAGLNVVPFSGRIGTTALKPGTYRARLIATDDSNNRSPIAAKTFTVVKK